MIQLQGDQRNDVKDFMMDKTEGLGLDGENIKASRLMTFLDMPANKSSASRLLKLHGLCFQTTRVETQRAPQVRPTGRNLVNKFPSPHLIPSGRSSAMGDSEYT